MLDSIVDKRLDLSAVHDAATWCRDAGLDVMAFYVIGFPGETPADMQGTVEFALDLYRDYDVKPNHFLATPLPGTRLEKILLDKKLFDSPLSTEQLAAMMQGQFRVDGGTFSRADVDQVMNGFLSGYRRQFVINALRFLILRPYGIVRVLMVMYSFNSSMPMMNRLFSALQLKHSALELRR